MLFELALTLTVASVLLEFFIVTKYAFILELLSRNVKPPGFHVGSITWNHGLPLGLLCTARAAAASPRPHL